MLELFGSGYIIDRCVSALRLDKERKLYLNYIADGVYAISKVVSNAYGGPNLRDKVRDLIDPPKEDDRTADEVIEGIQAKLKAMG